ncbi:MAG: hypothetical protein KAI24_18560 [Planctomycetes bacterium]|nr:hypothetical protein [Planctomycetota bacterium]
MPTTLAAHSQSAGVVTNNVTARGLGLTANIDNTDPTLHALDANKNADSVMNHPFFRL